MRGEPAEWHDASAKISVSTISKKRPSDHCANSP